MVYISQSDTVIQKSDLGILTVKSRLVHATSGLFSCCWFYLGRHNLDCHLSLPMSQDSASPCQVFAFSSRTYWATPSMGVLGVLDWLVHFPLPGAGNWGEAGCFDTVLSTHKSTLLPRILCTVLVRVRDVGEVSAGDISW